MARDYLNKAESSMIINMEVLLAVGNKGRAKMLEVGSITKTEHKALKMALTMMRKFIDGVVMRQSEKEREKLKSRLEKYELKVMDQHTLNRLNGQLGDEAETVHLPRAEFFTYCEMILLLECNGCQKSHRDCEIHDLMYNNFMPESGYHLENCRYAYENNIKRKRDEKRGVKR